MEGEVTNRLSRGPEAANAGRRRRPKHESGKNLHTTRISALLACSPFVFLTFQLLTSQEKSKKALLGKCQGGMKFSSQGQGRN